MSSTKAMGPPALPGRAHGWIGGMLNDHSTSSSSYSFYFTCSIHLDSRNPFTGHVIKLFLDITSTSLDTSYLTSPQKLAAQRILVADTLLIKRDFRIWTKSAKNI